jgi:Zn-dependent peptidase ImmA (M78 family)
MSDAGDTTDPWVERSEALEDLQHALIIGDAALRRAARERIDAAERRAATAQAATHSAGPKSWKWTNPSVVALAKFGDPIEVITKRARDLALSALADGWSGPPYDPLALARMNDIEVLPTQLKDEEDARLVSVDGRVRIEFNPTRKPDRRRFSVAHEIAHTLFEDYADAVRNRKVHSGSSNEWQLEMLCNLAAAELLMPPGSFFKLESEDPSIERVLDLHKELGVSTEAVLRRITQLTPRPFLTFVASPISSTDRSTQYRIDYTTPSRSWPIQNTMKNRVLPDGAVPERCAAIGFTAKSEREEWLPGARVECVGLPPYPGQRRPRVAGFAVLSDVTAAPATRYWEVIGDATQPQNVGLPPAIAHVVNDRALRWHGRFSNALQRRWPTAQLSFRDWAAEGHLALGAVHRADVDHVVLYDMVAQRGYGPARTSRLRYNVLRDCLAQVGAACAQEGRSLHLPRIGSGEAAGDWELIRELIVDEVADRGVEVVVYVPEGEVVLPTARQPSLFSER